MTQVTHVNPTAPADPSIEPIQPPHKVAPADDVTRGFRPPSVPLIAVDPYLSIWSAATRLTDELPRHWTGPNHSLGGVLRIDGKPFRFMGHQPVDVKAMRQTDLKVLPTRTIYQFTAAGIALTLTFMTPALPHNLDLYSWPVTYLTFDLAATDGRRHDVALYLDVSAELCVNTSDQLVNFARFNVHGATALRVGSVEQPVLKASGDNRRIDWGYCYLLVPTDPQTPSRTSTYLGPKDDALEQFCSHGTIPAEDDLVAPRRASDRWPGMVTAMAATVGPDAPVARHVILLYDDLYSIEYFQRKLRPYWNRRGMGTNALVRAALDDYQSLRQRCREFDTELMADLTTAGGEKFAAICALAYRQTAAAHKLVADIDGTPLYMSKENFSNGCIATVDVTYPSAPFFLLFNPELLKAQLTPILDYANSPRWRFPFAPHDLGTYPQANGQVYGGGEETERDQMPVEECGNMLILLAALAVAEDDIAYPKKYWPLLTRWAEYLLDKGFDPEKQLCTDDFAGRLAHNTNLSIKAIVALGAFAQLARTIGDDALAARCQTAAEDMAKSWCTAADDGDHYRLAFDKPGTWSLKYNLVWDRLLKLDLFPPEVMKKELAFYRSVAEPYGVPLDNRKPYTKIDWIFWIAALAETDEQFNELIDPVYDFLNKTPQRVPIADWYYANNAKQVGYNAPGQAAVGFQARSVVGGLFMQLLFTPEIWKKWRDRATQGVARS
jgi:hypothetical protein